MYSVLKKRKNFEELINDLQSFDSLVKYPSRKASIIKEWVDTITSNITDPSQISDEALKQILHDKAIQTSLIEMSDKATQTDKNEKGVQVNIIPEPGKYTKFLHPYAGAEVVDHSGWFNKVRKQKATQVLRIPRSIDPLSNWEPPSTPSTPFSSKEEKAYDLPDIVEPILNTLFAPLNFGLGLINFSHPLSVHSSPAISVHRSPPISVHSSPPISVHSSPPISVHSSPPISVHSSPPISVHSSPPISVHSSSSSSTSRITSPPISVASSHHVLSPTSPSYLPVQEEANSPASSSRSSRKSKSKNNK